MHTEHQRKINELIDAMALDIKTEVARLIKSGGIDVDSYDHDEYVLAKILVTVAAKNKSDSFAPLPKTAASKAIKNLSHF